ncbi:unnamed protein product [Euphydryas editha]|uniref:Uncharacterized protein n=1 Tax=Euphydryas editha TaxID=104508 RepID=A0AAU9UKM9_EUPED|nr:unnamed protein product [Euphydryas editha]
MATGQVHASEFESEEFAYDLVKKFFYDYLYTKQHCRIPRTRENVKHIISVLKSDDFTGKAPYGSSYYQKNIFEKGTICGNNLKQRNSSENKVYLFIENFQGLKGDEYNVLFYIDEISQYVLLRPLQKNANKEEIAFELLKIFTNFGVPGWILTCLKFELINEALEILTSFDLPFDMPLLGKSSNEHQWDILIDSVKLSILTAESAIDNESWTITLCLMQLKNNTCDRISSNSLTTPYSNLFGMAPNISRIEENVKETSSCKEANACGECFRQIYKKYQCHNCKEFFHFTCCIRYLQAEDDNLNQIMVMCFSCKRALLKK